MDRGELHKDNMVSTALGFTPIFMLNTLSSQLYIVMSSLLLILSV